MEELNMRSRFSILAMVAGGALAAPLFGADASSAPSKSGDRAITLQDLQKDVNQGVSIKFVPERRGDIARTIQLNG
jgi:hypothetical protein